MENGRQMVALVAVILVVLGGAKAVSFCNMTEEGFEACRPSVTQPNPVEPSSECCGALSKADLKCLCSYKNSVVLPSFGIDPDLALGLPVKCNLAPPADC